MAEIKGTNVASKIVPYTDSDEYATHDEKYGVGGYRTVDSVSEMNAIPAARRKEGMLVYVKNDRYYRLNSSNTFEDAGIGSAGGGGSGLDWDSAHNFSQNGYQKFNNGLMLQWGNLASSGSNYSTTLYFPTSFKDINYNVQISGILANTTERIVFKPSVYNKTISYCTFYSYYIGNGTNIVQTTRWRSEWIAIGRWK